MNATTLESAPVVKTRKQPVPVSVTLGDAPAVAKTKTTNTPNATPKWSVKSEVVCNNGKTLSSSTDFPTEPSSEDVRQCHREALDLFRAHLPEGMTFDNSASSVTVERI